MKNENTKFINKIKYYHILILGLVLCPFIIINSNNVNNRRAEEKLNEEKSRLFNKIISRRYLDEEPEKEEEEEKANGTDEVCKRGSDELNNYYKTGNLADIKLKDGPIKSEDKDKGYMKALINIIKSQLGSKEEDEENNEPPENPDGAPDGTGDGSGLRNLGEDDEEKEGEGGGIPTDDIIAYGKHLLPVLVFLVVAILCIPGWLICCFCCCCNCYCCCCCKKKCCKIPCFVITFALYALVVAVCIYGVSRSNHIFVGIADTECSILRFFDEILEGEIKTDTPRWAGFEGIIDILDEMSGEISGLTGSTQTQLSTAIHDIEDPKKDFLKLMKESSERFKDKSEGEHNKYLDLYSKYYSGLGESNNGEYVLDLIKMFGYYDSEEGKFLPDGSTLDLWEREYKIVAENADSKMDQAYSGFSGIIEGETEDYTKPLDDGKEMINDIKGQFNDIKGTVADMIIDKSETIDNYGKLGIKAVFGVLALINVAIAAFMLLLCFCSGKCCNKCCCCRCICKCFTHLLWNILALLMIVVFLVGSLFALIGKVGNDAMSVISYVVSEDNIGEGGDGVIVDQIGEEYIKYINTCLGGNGSIIEDLGLDLDQIGSFNNISDAETQIRNAKNEFNEKKEALYTYNLYIDKLNQRVALTDQELSLVHAANNNDKILNFKQTLGEMNKIIEDNDVLKSRNEKWDIISDETACPSDQTIPSQPKTYNPKYCNPLSRNWVSNTASLKNKAQIISDTLKFVDEANKEGDIKYYRQTLEDLKSAYKAYLGKYVDALDTFNNTISKITNKLDKYTGGSEMFSFINCSFVGTNLKIILKYLKEIFGGDIYTIGVCLILSGCSMALSISFTILLIVVINVSVDENKKNAK